MKDIDWKEVTGLICGVLAEAYGPARKTLEETARKNDMDIHSFIGLSLAREISLCIEKQQQSDLN